MSRKMSSQKIRPMASLPKGEADFLLAEFGKLRDEILKRTDIQHQLVSLALVATGTFIVIESTTIKLTYPILALFLSVAWMQNDIRIGQLGGYIREQIEGRLGGIGWEHYHAPIGDLGPIKNLARFASRGILCGTQILIVLVALRSVPSALDRILCGVDTVAILATYALLSLHEKKRKHAER
jgi:hypothetical protein